MEYSVPSIASGDLLQPEDGGQAVATLTSQSSAVSSAPMTSRSRYTLAIQPLFDVLSCALVGQLLASSVCLLADDEPGAVWQGLRPGPEDARLEEPVEPGDQLRGQRHRHGLSVSAHTSMFQ